MIICKNCGAEYDDEQDRCPYCGGDNFGKSVQVHEDTIHDLEREKRQWEKMPEKVAGKGMSWTAKIGIAAILLVIIICIITFISTFFSRKISYRQDQKNLRALESMYQEGDYEGIYQYVRTMDNSYNTYYDKYTNIEKMQAGVRNLEPEKKERLDWIRKEDKPEFLNNIDYLIRVLRMCQEAEDASYKYAEQDAVAHYREICYKYLWENYNITEEEVLTYAMEAGGLDYDNEFSIAGGLKRLALDHIKEKME